MWLQVNWLFQLWDCDTAIAAYLSLRALVMEGMVVLGIGSVVGLALLVLRQLSHSHAHSGGGRKVLLYAGCQNTSLLPSHNILWGILQFFTFVLVNPLPVLLARFHCNLLMIISSLAVPHLSLGFLSLSQAVCMAPFFHQLGMPFRGTLTGWELGRPHIVQQGPTCGAGQLQAQIHFGQSLICCNWHWCLCLAGLWQE